MLVLIADNGPDWSSSSKTNCLFLLRLFKALDLDALLLTSYAPGESAYNPIEHLWSFVTVALSGTQLSATVPGEKILPMNQNSLSGEQKRDKLATVLDNAMEKTSRVLNKLHFDTFPMHCTYQHCSSKNLPFFDYEEVKRDLTSGVRNYRQNEVVKREFEFLTKHVDRRIDFLALKKCKDPACTYCISRPWKSIPVKSFFEQNRAFPDPTFDPQFSGHFYTFLDHINGRVEAATATDLSFYRRQEIIQKIGLPFRCPICPSYLFRSKADRQIHFSFLHRNNHCTQSQPSQ